MLNETFIASIAAPIKALNTSFPKDAGIFVHEFLPLPALHHVLKKSATPQNCLAVSATHIFAAQAEKAVVHVYNRNKGSQEAVIPFQERIHAIALTVDDTVLALGMQSGRLLLWEICTGRLVSAPVSHLQQITSIVADGSSNFLLTGSEDSSVNVWSLPHLLSFSSSTECKSPLHSLSPHRGAITSLSIGHSSTSANIAVSTSRDNTAIIWDYQSGKLLRTYLLSDTPISTCLDPADRAFYTAFEDGSVQLINFFDAPDAHDTLRSTSSNAAASVVEPAKTSRWKVTAENLTLGPALSLALSWDGTTLLSGHASGKIATWDIARGAWASTLTPLPGPVTNITMLPPTGFPHTHPPAPRTRIAAVVKPRFESTTSDLAGPVPPPYTSTTQFASALPSPHVSLSPGPASTDAFATCLAHTTFPAAVLSAGLAELAAWSSPSQQSPTVSGSADFMPLGDDSAPAVPVLSEAERIQDLEGRLAAQQRVLEVMSQQLAGLRKERLIWGGARPHATQRRTKNGTGKQASEANGDEMDVDESGEEADEIDIDTRLRYHNSSDVEGNEPARNSVRKGRRKGNARQAKITRISRP